MIKELEKLKDSEVELMLKAPVLLCILIAGADGTIDRKEIKKAIHVTVKKKDKTILDNYFREVSQDFEDKLKILLQSYPFESAERNPILITELSHLNPILKKMDKSFSKPFYDMLKELAEKIAGSSGGLWGMMTVDSEEAKFIDLPMIDDPSENNSHHQ
jgi:ribosomal protein S17E